MLQPEDSLCSSGKCSCYPYFHMYCTGIPAVHVESSVDLKIYGVTGGGMNGQMGGPRGSGGLFNSPMPDR